VCAPHPASGLRPALRLTAAAAGRSLQNISFMAVRKSNGHGFSYENQKFLLSLAC